MRTEVEHCARIEMRRQFNWWSQALLVAVDIVPIMLALMEQWISEKGPSSVIGQTKEVAYQVRALWKLYYALLFQCGSARKHSAWKHKEGIYT